MGVGHRYTDEEHSFLRSFIPGHTYKEIVEEYNKRFEDPITLTRVKGYMANHRINNGLTGRFEKGHVPVNKGQKGVCAKGSEKTWFKDGHLPHNTKPIGYERITRDGYTEVKVAMRPSRKDCNDNFVLKHRLIWEQANGPIPKGYIVTFKDGDKANCDIDNLALISQAENITMMRQNLRSSDAALTETGVLIARAEVTMRKRKKGKKNENN